MPTEFQTLVMRAKASHVDRAGAVTLTLEQVDSTPQVAALLYQLVVEQADVTVVADKEARS